MTYDPERHGPRRIIGPGFFERVFAVVSKVPAGQVTTYGDVAAELGMRSVARKVGHALAGLAPDRDDVPWHRVVNAQGEISARLKTGGGQRQARRLEREGVEVSESGKVVDFSSRRFSLSIAGGMMLAALRSSAAV